MLNYNELFKAKRPHDTEPSLTLSPWPRDNVPSLLRVPALLAASIDLLCTSTS